MSGTRGRYAGPGSAANDAVAARLAAERRRRVLKIVVVVNVVALIAAIAGCLFMMGSQGLRADIAKMRDEVGESLTMMTLGGASEAVARHIPAIITATAHWDRKFAAKSEAFRGMDAEIDHVRAMQSLGAKAERWRREMEGVSPMQRSELWQKSLKAQVEAEQKKWPNRTHQKDAAEWLQSLWAEFWGGLRQGFVWPRDIYDRVAQLVAGGRAVDSLGFGDRFHFILFPYYSLSAFTMLRLAGIAFATTGLGYLLCWLGLKTRFGWLSYVGLVYFFYLINVAVFIVWLGVTK